MNKSLIAVSIAAALATSMANAAPKVYGKLNLSAESYQKDLEDVTKTDEDYTRMVSNASRFGLKEEAELTADLSAIYTIEWQVRADGDTGADLSERNRFLGIKSQNYGTLKLGKYDTYTKLSQGETDLFNDYAGDMEWTLAGENRINNVIGYESPKFMNTQVSVMTQTQDTAANAKNGSSLSVVHNNEEAGLYLALAADMNVDSKTALFGTRESDNLRLTASYKLAGLTLNAAFGTSEKVDGKDGEESMLLGVAYKLNDFVLKAQHSTAEADDESKVAAGSSAERTMSSLGADYNITSKTKAFAWYTTREDVKKGVGNDIEETILAAGVEHKF